MKKIKYLFPVLFACFLVLTSFESKAIKFIFGTRSHPAREGPGCEGDRGLCIRIEIKILDLRLVGAPLGDDMGTADLVLLNKGQLRFDILSDNASNNNGPLFTVEKDITLSAEASQKLGVNSLTIRAGTYKVDFSKFERGSVILPVMTQ